MFLFWIFFYNRNGISFTIWDRWIIHGKEEFTLLDFINAVKVRQLFISCFESVSFIHNFVRGFYKYYLAGVFSLFTGCKTLSSSILYLGGVLIVSFGYSLSGEVRNWANNGGTGSQNALCPCYAWSCKKIEVNVSIEHYMQDILKSWNISWMHTRKLNIEVIEVQIKICDLLLSNGSNKDSDSAKLHRLPIKWDL